MNQASLSVSSFDELQERIFHSFRSYVGRYYIYLNTALMQSLTIDIEKLPLEMFPIQSLSSYFIFEVIIIVVTKYAFYGWYLKLLKK